MKNGIFRKRLVESFIDFSEEKQLNRSLSLINLLGLGLGAIIGTGIFVTTGIIAAKISGPAVTLSFLAAGLICMIIAFAYTEVATLIPTSGGVYTYAYVALGELIAFIVGWITILYFLITAATVCTGWSGYMVSILKTMGLVLPSWAIHAPQAGGIVNIPAIVIALIVTLLLLKGTKMSVSLNSILVIIKLAIIIIFIAIAIPHFDISNWFVANVTFDNNLLGSTNFMPFGIAGVTAGAAQAFFSYNGFDSIANAAGEVKNPNKNIKYAIIGSLSICIILYVSVAGLLVGMAPYNELTHASPLADILTSKNMIIGSSIISIGAIAGMTTVILVNFFALSRLLFVMSEDGLLPKFLSKVKNKTPYRAIILIGFLLALISGFATLDVIMSLASMCALITFIMVSIILLILRINKPELKRKFSCPIAFILCPLVIIICSYMVYSLMPYGGNYLLIWLALGLILYFSYARNHSKLHQTH